MYDVQEQSLYIGLEIKSKSKKQDAQAAAEIQPLELFGFGSGDFAEGPEAGDIMGDITGRWVSYALGASSEQVILEVDKRLPDHIRKCDIFGKARVCSGQKSSRCPFHLDSFGLWLTGD